MLQTIINVLEKILTVLKKNESREIDNKTGENITSKKSKVLLILISIIIIVLLSILWLELLFAWSLMWIIWWALVQIILLTTLYKNLNWKYFFLIHMPIYISLFVCIFWFWEGYPFQNLWLYGILMWLGLSIYPCIHILQYYFKFLDTNIVNKIKSLFYLYNLGFFFFMAFLLALSILWWIFGISIIQNSGFSLIFELLNANPYGFLQAVLIFLLTFFILLYWIYSLHVYFDNKAREKKYLHKAIGLFVLVYALWFTNHLSEYFYEYQIEKAELAIVEWWENYESYENAKVLFLGQAFLNKIKNKRSIDEELFQKIYDTTPEGYYGEKISEYRDTRRSFATNESKTWDKAEVVFTLAEIENKVIETQGREKTKLLETKYTFHFSNQSNSNQEVILNFESPNKMSVVSWLRLWLDLELIWQIAPRWAAQKVYEESLRYNIDPALIEKVWLSTYNLRVFPIPSKTDGWSQGRQKVEITMLTPLAWEAFLYSPKFSIINLKFDESSNLLSKIYVDDTLYKEEVIKWGDIEEYMQTDHVLNIDDLWIQMSKRFEDFCLDPWLQAKLGSEDVEISLKKQQLWNKTSIFFDNSASAQRNGMDSFYEDIYEAFKNHDGLLNDIDIYSYNFDVQRLADMDDINYWGYSNIDRTLDYIVNNSLQNQRIIFVTDDDNFNLETQEWRDRDLEIITSNSISVIKLWNRVKTYKTDFNTILAASQWNIYWIVPGDIYSDTIAKIYKQDNSISLSPCSRESWDVRVFMAKSSVSGSSEWTLTDNELATSMIERRSWNEIRFESYSDDFFKKHYPIWFIFDERVAQIQAWIVSDMLFRAERFWEQIRQGEVMEIQTSIAQKTNIVNQFNSIIALETDRQQQNLDKYSQWANKYDVEYNNNGGINKVSRGWINPTGSSINSNLRSVDRVNPGLSISESISWYSNSSLFSSSMKVSLLWFLIACIYLLQYIGCINFVIKYIRSSK